VKTIARQQITVPRLTISSGSSGSEAVDWQNFANGGVQAHDTANRQLAITLQSTALQEATIQARNKLDDEASWSLFGVHTTASVVPASTTPTKVSVTQVNSNLLINISDDPPPESRWRWKETFTPLHHKPKPISEGSLLD
jgi:hypothetical protein